MSQMEEPEYDESGDENDEQEDEFEQMLGMNVKRDIWKDNLSQKNEVVRELIKCFASMVEFRVKEFSIADHKGKYRTEDKVYEKLLDAPKFVTRAKRALISNENFDTRNFSIFIAHKGWIKHILRPLLELCAKDDCILAMRCCSLALVLIRRISDSSQKIITDHTKGAKRKASSLDLQLNEDDREDDEKVSGASGPDGAEKKSGSGGNNADADARKAEKEKETLQLRVENVKQQLSALLSFKEALCSDKCNEAISNAFKEFWLKEQITSTEDNKTGVAICFSYLRRILAIDSHPQWSSIGEIQLHRAVHDRYIVQLRLLLSVIPGVCSDLLDAYHNDWLGDIILIIYFTLRGFEPKDLHRVWRTGALIENFDNIDTYELIENTNNNSGGNNISSASAAPKPLAEVIIPTALITSAKQSTTVNGKGRLSQLLQKEKNNSLVGSGQATLTGSRFKGTYQKNVTSTVLPVVNSSTAGSAGTGSNGNNTTNVRNSALDAILGPAATTASTDSAVDAEATAGTVNVHLQVSKIVKDPFNLHQPVVPAVQAKRNRKNLTFNMEDSRAEATSAHYATSTDHQKAAVVAATLVNLLSSELSLKPLVKRVNDDLRRDDMRVGQELELRYFDILYRVLHYNRLKLADEYRDFLHAESLNSSTGATRKNPTESAKVTPSSWQPNLKNVMDALDRMSFMRVVTAIERLGKNPLHNDDIVIPLALFKEMICYLRVLLESDLTGHHEIAVAALYRLYYASSERLDPLPRLLSAWKSGTYPKRHLNVLVELVHETLKTLETAQVKFRAAHEEDGRNAHKKQRKLNKKEMDMEQYEMACVRFVTDEYFKRYIATNHSVRMYTKLLSHYASNDVAVNYYVYSFLKRLNAFTLEQEHRAPMPPTTDLLSNPSSQSNTTTDPDQVSLGFMLYNIHTLEVFSTIVNDRDVYTNSSLEPLVRLIKAILRRFFGAATKNRMLFVELLFVHPRPHDFCVSLDSVYEASSYATYSHGTAKSGKNSTTTGEEANNATSESSSDSDDTEYGDEFDENNLTSAFAADPTAPKVGNKKEKKEKKVKEGKKKRAKRVSADDLEDTDNSDGEVNPRKERAAREKSGSGRDNDSDREVTTHRSKPQSQKPSASQPQQQSRLSQRASSRAWSLEEDEVLKEQFKLYAGSHSVFSSIAHCPELRALGNNRNEAQVQKRVTQLQLHLSVAHSDSENSAASSGRKASKKRDATQSKRQGKKQRKGESAGDETQEQLVSQGHTQSSKRHQPHHHEDTIMFSDHDENDDSSVGSGSGYDSEGVLNISGDLGSPTQLDHTGMNSDGEGSQTQPQQQLLSPDMRNDLAGLFSPLPNSSAGAGNSSKKRARLTGKADDNSAATSNPFWELQDGELDVFEQRSLALMKSTGGATYGLSDDEDSLFGANNKTKKTTTAKHNKPTTTSAPSVATKKGLTKTTTVVESDDESLVFESSSTSAATTAAASKASAENAAPAQDAKTMNKRRLMRVDDDEDD